MFFLLHTFKFLLLCGLVVTIYLPKNSCQIPSVGWFWIWVVFYCSLLFILSALIGSQQVWVSVPVVSIGFCNSLEYVPCAYLEYVPCADLPNRLTFFIIDSLAADKKAHKKCWCLFRVCNVAVNLVFLLPNGTTCVFSSLLCLVFHVQRQSCRHSETSLWLRTCVFSSSSIICFLIFNFPKEDCFLSGFVENWRFSVDVWQQELWAFGLRQRSRLTLRWSEENWVGWEQWRKRRAFIPIGDVGGWRIEWNQARKWKSIHPNSRR